MYCSPDTLLDAKWWQILVNPGGTECAFLYHSLVGVETDSVVGTGHLAGLATITLGFIDENNTISTLIYSFLGTCIYARWLLALHAGQGLPVHCQLRVLATSFGHYLHP